MLLNKTKNKIIIPKTKIANEPLLRFKGLMFEEISKFDYGLVFVFSSEGQVRNSIHMFFVGFPILAVFMDKNKKIVDIAKLEPFVPNYTPKQKASFLVELPVSCSPFVSLGDILEW